MFDFEFEHIVPGQLKEGSSTCGNSLWILYADKIPPHVGLSIDNAFYSLKANGRDHGLELQRLMSLIRQKRIPCFKVELLQDISEGDVESIFGMYEKTIPFEISCLHPIKTILQKEDVSKLSELLERLCVKNEIGEVYGYFLSDDMKGIRSYEVNDIYKRLERLTHE